MHDCHCSDTLRQEVSVTLLNVIKSTSIDRTPFDQGDLDTYQGMPVGFTQAGYPYLGDSHAPVTLEKYSHFLFPFCACHFEQTVPTLVKQYVHQTGQAKYVFRDMPLVGLHSTAPVGYVAVRFIQHNSGETYTLVGTYPVDTFSQWLDALAAGNAPPQEEEPEPPELPYWANADGLAPDLNRPG